MGAGAWAWPDDGAPGLVGLKHGISESECLLDVVLVWAREESNNCFSL